MYVYQKVLGWGLLDVQGHDGYITDPRINTSSPLFEHNAPLYNADELRINYIDHAKSIGTSTSEIRDQVRSLLRDESISLSDSLTYYAKGLSNVLVLTPLALTKQWKRSADPLDYARDMVDVVSAHKSTATRLASTFRPVNNRYMDKNTKTSLDTSTAYRWMRVYLRKLSFEEKHQDLPFSQQEQALKSINNELDMLSMVLGYSSTQAAVDGVWGVVPTDVVLLSRYAELFTSRTVIYDLVPVFYEVRFDTNLSREEANDWWKNSL